MTIYKDYYKILEVNRTSSKKEISSAYHKLALIYHPDKNFKDKEILEKKFLEIIEAYKILKNPQTRAEYDKNYQNPSLSLFKAFIQRKLSISEIEEYIKAGANINFTNKQQQNILMLAANRGEVEIVKFLCKNGANLNSYDIRKVNVLMYAILKPNFPFEVPEEEKIEIEKNSTSVNLNNTKTILDNFLQFIIEFYSDLNYSNISSIIEHFFNVTEENKNEENISKLKQYFIKLKKPTLENKPNITFLLTSGENFNSTTNKTSHDEPPRAEPANEQPNLSAEKAEIVKYLLQNGVNISHINIYNGNAIGIALKEKIVPIIKELKNFILSQSAISAKQEEIDISLKNQPAYITDISSHETSQHEFNLLKIIGDFWASFYH